MAIRPILVLPDARLRAVADPVDKIDGYATKLNVDTTPTLVFADGGVLRQYVAAKDIDRFLNETPPK